jgi:hypothetical protein
MNKNEQMPVPEIKDTIVSHTPEKEIGDLGGITQEKEIQIIKQQEISTPIQQEVIHKEEERKSKITQLRESISSLWKPNKEKTFIDDEIGYIKKMVKMGKISPVSEDQIKAVIEDAKLDNFEGKIGFDKDKNVIYKKASDVNWGTADQHVFGSGK